MRSRSATPKGLIVVMPLTDVAVYSAALTEIPERLNTDSKAVAALMTRRHDNGDDTWSVAGELTTGELLSSGARTRDGKRRTWSGTRCLWPSKNWRKVST